MKILLSMPDNCTFMQASFFAPKVTFFKKSKARAGRFQNSPFFHGGSVSQMKEGLKQLKSTGCVNWGQVRIYAEAH
jgi:hypothetical protein